MASGDTLAIFHPYGNEPPASAYATLDHRNVRPVLDFDTGAKEAAIWSSVMPQHYAGGGIDVIIEFTAEGDTTNDADWDGSFEDRTGFDLDGNGFAAVQQVIDVSVSGTDGIAVKATINFTNAQIDGVTAGSGFRFKLERPTTDTATGDLEVHSVELRET
jgi:hypothetical protein